jgi:hypothetical protein
MQSHYAAGTVPLRPNGRDIQHFRPATHLNISRI